MGQTGLGVDDFEGEGFSGGVAEAGEAEAFAGGVGAGAERGDLAGGDAGFVVVLVELRDELALGVGEGGLGGLLVQLALTDAVVSGEPIPEGEVDGGGGGVAEVANAVGAVDGELRRVDAVGVVEAEGGKVRGAGGEYFAVGGVEGFEGAAEIGVVASGGGFDAGLVWERFGGLGLIGEGVRRAWIGEEEDAEVEAGLDVYKRQGEGEGAEVVGGVGHEDGVGGGFEHGDVVPVVADGHDLGGGDVAGGGEGEDGGALGAVGGEDVEDREVAVGVFGAVEGEEGLGGAVEARLRKATHPFRYDWKGWATQRCAGAAGGVSGGGDAGMLEEAGLGAGHAVDGSAEHGLNGGVEGCAGCGEGVFDGVDVGDVGFVDLHPAADGGVEVFEVFDDERAASVLSVGADAVEGEDEGVAEFFDVGAEPEGGDVWEVGAGEELGGLRRGTKCPGHRPVGADEGEGVVQAEGTQDAHGVGVAATGGDDDLDAGCVGGVEGGEGARGDVAVLVEEGSVHVDCDEADGGHGGCGYCIGEALTIVRSTLFVGSGLSLIHI